MRQPSLRGTPEKPRVTAVAALAFAVTLLAGCSSSTSGTPSSGATTGVATTEPTPDTATADSGEDDSNSVAAEDSSTEGSGTGDSSPGDANSPDLSAGDSDTTDPFTANPNGIALTPAGTKLSFGQSATVPMASGADQGVITMGRFTLAKGSDADWTALEGEGYDPAGTTPWYLKLTVTVESGSEIAFDSMETNLQGAVTGQDAVHGDIAFQDNSICPIATVADTFSAGQSYDSCIILAVPTGQSVSQITFAGDESPYTTEYIENPVVWTAG